MNTEIHRDPFGTTSSDPPHPPGASDFDIGWFDEARRLRCVIALPAPSGSGVAQPAPIDDPLADPWFR